MREETRRRLIEAGGRALADRGLDGVRTAAVARAAGVANGTFYLHFDDRDALVAAVVETALTELASALAEIRDSGDGLAGTDRAAVEAIVDCAEANRDIMIGAMRASWHRVGMQPFEGLLAQRRAEMESAGLHSDQTGLDVRVAVQAEFAALTGTLAWWLTTDTGVTRDELVDSLVSVVSRLSA